MTGDTISPLNQGIFLPKFLTHLAFIMMGYIFSPYIYSFCFYHDGVYYCTLNPYFDMFFFYDWVYYSTHKHFYALQTLLGDKLTTTGPEPIYGYSIIIYFSVYEYLIINNETIVRQPCVFFIRVTVSCHLVKFRR